MNLDVAKRDALMYRFDSGFFWESWMNSEVRRRLKSLADDLEGPLGPVPFDRALRGHIELFEELRRQRCTWSQIARALAAVGIRRTDGGTVSADHLRGAVSRQMKRNASMEAAGQPVSVVTPSSTVSRARAAANGNGDHTHTQAGLVRPKTVALKQHPARPPKHRRLPQAQAEPIDNRSQDGRRRATAPTRLPR